MADITLKFKVNDADLTLISKNIVLTSGLKGVKIDVDLGEGWQDMTTIYARLVASPYPSNNVNAVAIAEMQLDSEGKGTIPYSLWDSTERNYLFIGLLGVNTTTHKRIPTKYIKVGLIEKGVPRPI